MTIHKLEVVATRTTDVYYTFDLQTEDIEHICKELEIEYTSEEDIEDFSADDISRIWDYLMFTPEFSGGMVEEVGDSDEEHHQFNLT